MQDVVETAVCEGDLVEHHTDACTVSDIALQCDGWAAVRDTGAGDADSEAIFIGDFLGCALGCIKVHIDADDVRAFLDEAMRGFLADA